LQLQQGCSCEQLEKKKKWQLQRCSCSKTVAANSLTEK
jgi:hypothetical protein